MAKLVVHLQNDVNDLSDVNSVSVFLHWVCAVGENVM